MRGSREISLVSSLHRASVLDTFLLHLQTILFHTFLGHEEEHKNVTPGYEIG